jgi:hypothetical protein
MPYRPKMIAELPGWIYEISGGDECLRDVLVEAWVAEQHARRAVLQRDKQVPRTCSEELKAATGILKAIETGDVPRSQIAQKAAQAVRKFDSARQCARFLERDSSPVFAGERRARPSTRIRRGRS